MSGENGDHIGPLGEAIRVVYDRGGDGPATTTRYAFPYTTGGDWDDLAHTFAVHNATTCRRLLLHRRLKETLSCIDASPGREESQESLIRKAIDLVIGHHPDGERGEFLAMNPDTARHLGLARGDVFAGCRVLTDDTILVRDGTGAGYSIPTGTAFFLCRYEGAAMPATVTMRIKTDMQAVTLRGDGKVKNLVDDYGFDLDQSYAMEFRNLAPISPTP